MARDWTDAVTELDGVGAKTAETLEKLGITTIESLLWSFPFRYEDLSIQPVEALQDGEKAAIQGTIATQPVVQYFRGRRGNRLSFKLKSGDAFVAVNFFNQAYLKKQFEAGDELVVYGSYNQARQSLTVIRYFKAGSTREDEAGVYHTASGLSQKKMKGLVRQALERYADVIPERLPKELVARYQLPTLAAAIQELHQPTSEAHHRAARQRVTYEELFLYLFRLQLARARRHRERDGIRILYNNERLKAFIQTLPFELTDGQKQVVNAISADLRQPWSMRRLLQGDVGSGKTVVALLAAVAAATVGYQTAVMVPTEILAEQHFTTWDEQLAETPYRVELLTGKTPARERQQLLSELSAGDIDILVGTHALIQPDVAFQRLGLAVIDEQHRFGVKQRAALLEKAADDKTCNALYMTATPIPRTLEITVMGDMDVSHLTERPAGRQRVKTYWRRKKQGDGVDQLLRREVASGHQVYIVCPMIDESEAVAAANAEAVCRAVQRRYRTMRVGLLHGNLSDDDKAVVMRRFHAGELDILVTTTVIEVGINVPNATVMLILDADRFGLAQLHQLRGRIGRGQAQAYCILFADPTTEAGRERMHIMEQSADGFYLSQKDLELRGAGDYFGTRQSGWPAFAVADPLRDAAVLEQARQDVAIFVPHYLAHAADYPALTDWLAAQAGYVSA